MKSNEQVFPVGSLLATAQLPPKELLKKSDVNGQKGLTMEDVESLQKMRPG